VLTALRHYGATFLPDRLDQIRLDSDTSDIAMSISSKMSQAECAMFLLAVMQLVLGNCEVPSDRKRLHRPSSFGMGNAMFES
jgi:hypothetical protein